MMYLPVVLFAIAALGGLTLAVMKFTGKGLPWPLVIGHGIFAASGLVALIINVFNDTQNFLMNLSLILFLITAIGGFTVLSFHLRKKKQPYSLIFIHGTAAVISFVLLIIAVTM
ncbi:MAG: hypothetical protein CVU55_09085 [Deltaproteobacteria bacterium HGW-Deltaproteobacteria-13]|jgi:hypothetical membrane protein|nr:MAG: hypothetical protein CVU55_09085 [Deltaproteobacteria bacterium HGW-Deltaproteobacteria-13]